MGGKHSFSRAEFARLTPEEKQAATRARRRAWDLANRDRVRAATRARYANMPPDRKRALQNKNNAYGRGRSARLLELGRIRRKKAVGRVCTSCGRSDKEICWGTGRADLCSACNKRMWLHGACGQCGAARYRDPQNPRRKRCKACDQAPKLLSAALLRLWDVAWIAAEPGAVVWQDVARALELKKHSAQKALERLRDSAVKLDIDAVWDGAGKTHSHGVQSVLRFNAAKLKAVVEAKEAS